MNSSTQRLISKHAVQFSSEFSDWRTPRGLFAKLDAEFHFTLDAAADDDNHLCERYFTIETNGLAQSWKGERVWLNPPYGREIRRWMEKAATEAAHADVVALVPSRTDTRWWHDYAMTANEIRFVKGRLDFEGPRRATRNDAPFPSAIVIWSLAAATRIAA